MTQQKSAKKDRLMAHRVGQLLQQLQILPELEKRVVSELGQCHAGPLLQQLFLLPLKPSHALTRLGSYSCRGAQPLAIRLQFAQERQQLEQTLLHEIAHFFDHQTRRRKSPYCKPHGPGWRHWLQIVGAENAACSSSSSVLHELHQQRLKPVARCERCGQVVLRLRRLAKNRCWVHGLCGGKLLPWNP